MAWGKSKSESEGSPPDDAAPATVDLPPAEPRQPELRDPVLIALIEQTEQLNERLTKLENRFDAAMAAGDGEDTDLRSLRVNSERLANELRRVTEDIDLTDSAHPRVGDDPTMRLPGANKRSGWLPIED